MNTATRIDLGRAPAVRNWSSFVPPNRTFSGNQLPGSISFTNPDNRVEEMDTEGLITLFVIVGLLVALDVHANRFGADSRSSNLDDRARSVAI